MNKNIAVFGIIGIIILGGIFYYVKDMRDQQIQEKESSFKIEVGS